MAGVFGGIFAIVGLAAIAVFLVLVLRYETKAYRTYRPADAVVIEAVPAGYDDAIEESKPGSATYAWTCNGKRHTQTSTMTEDGLSWHDAGGTKHSAGLSVGDTLTVWYDPTDPDRIRLSPYPRSYPVACLILLTPFVALAIRPIVADIRKNRRNAANAKPADSTACPRRPDWLGTYFLVSVLSIFVCAAVGILLPWPMDWAVTFALWAAVIPGLTAWIAQFRRSRLRREPVQPTVPSASRETDPSPQSSTDGADVKPSGNLRVYPLPAEPALARMGKGAVVAAAIGATFLTAFGGIFVGIYAYGMLMCHTAETSYVPVDGVILGTKVIHHSSTGRSSGSDRREPFVKYEYTVDGKVYTSKTVGYGRLLIVAGDGYASETMRRYSAGQEVTVHYDPSNPGRAVLEPQPSKFLFPVLLFFVPILIGGLAMWGTVVLLLIDRSRVRSFARADLRHVTRIPLWTRIRRRPGEGIAIRPGPSLRRAIGVFVSMFAVASFIAAVVLAVRRGLMNVSGLDAVWTTMQVGAVFGTLFAMWEWARSARRVGLLLDLTRRRMAVQARGLDLDLGLDTVRVWVVRTIKDPLQPAPKRGQEHARVPQLSIVTNDGQEHVVHVFPQNDVSPVIAHKTALWLADATDIPAVGRGKPCVDTSDMANAIELPLEDWPYVRPADLRKYT